MSDLNIMNTDDILKKYGFEMYASKPEKLNAGMGMSRTPDFMPKNPVLAMAYVPMQQQGEMYEPEAGLQAGTIFPDLDKPFYGRWND